MEEISNDKIIKDYDKEPIIIKDFNSLFMFLIMASMIPIMLYIYL